MSEWKSIQLGDTLSVSSGAGLPQHKIIFGNIPVYGGNGINGYHNDFLFEEQRIIIGRVGEHCGNVHLTKSKSWITDNALVVSFKEKENDLKFWFYYLTFLNLKEYAFRGAQPVITGATIDKIYSKIPDNYSEQRKIAHILSTADAVIEKTQAAIAKYKAIKQGMLHDLFTRGVDPATNKLRPTYEDAPHLYKPSKLGWIPREWAEGKFIDFADERISHSFTGGPFGSDLQTKHYTKTGVRIIQLQNIGDGIFNNNYKIYTSEEKANQLINCNIFQGEIIISKMADPIARACIIPNSEKRYLMASDGIRLSIDKRKYNSRFVMETINHKRFRTIAELKATGSTRARIGLTELREIPVVYPDKIEQDAIGLKLDTIENKLQTEQTYLHKIQQIKAGLMADLLSGEKKVTVDEASVN